MLLLGTIVLVLVLAACGTNNGNTGEDPITDPNENTGDAPITDPNDNSASEDNDNHDEQIENDVNEPNNESNDDSTNSEGELITETGIYNGQADPHTIEIETDEGPLAFQLTMDARDDIDALTEGGEVTYTYTEDGDTRTIESIQMNE